MVIHVKELIEKIKAKKNYHQALYKNYETDLIMLGSAKVRINAAKSKERVIAYDEILKLLKDE